MRSRARRLPWARQTTFVMPIPLPRPAQASDGSFSLVVSPGTYDVQVEYGGGANDPVFRICTQDVDLSTSIDDTLTVPVTQLTVNVQDSSGDPVQGATVGNPNVDGATATFDLIPGQAITYGYVETSNAQTNAAGTAVVPLMPMASPLILDVQPPAGSNLAPTTISTGLMTTNTTVTATLAEPVTLSGVLKDSLGNAVTGAQITVGPAGQPLSCQSHCPGRHSFGRLVQPRGQSGHIRRPGRVRRRRQRPGLQDLHAGC